MGASAGKPWAVTNLAIKGHWILLKKVSRNRSTAWPPKPRLLAGEVEGLQMISRRLLESAGKRLTKTLRGQGQSESFWSPHVTFSHGHQTKPPQSPKTMCLQRIAKNVSVPVQCQTTVNVTAGDACFLPLPFLI